MTDAPERIWVDWRPGLAVTNGPLADVYQGWVRADLHDAALARVAELEKALEYIMDGYGLDAPDFRQTETDEDGERVQDDWIVACIRAALAKKDAKP